MAGIYIAMAGQLYLTVGGGILGAALFPTGLIAVVLTSAELFTGDALVFIAGVLGGKVTVRKLVRNWTVSWIMNFVGCLFWAGLFGYASGAYPQKKSLQLKIFANCNYQLIFFLCILSIPLPHLDVPPL